MAAVRIPVYYDFASTLCFVAHRVLQRMREELDAMEIELLWSPLDLTGLASWRRGDPIQGSGLANTLRVARELKVEVRVPDQWMDSRAAMALDLELKGDPRREACRERIFSQIYEQGRSLDERDWLDALAREHDVAPEQIRSGRAYARIEVSTLEAAENQVTGVPTFLFGGWPVVGIQEIGTMRSMFSRFVERRETVH